MTDAEWAEEDEAEAEAYALAYSLQVQYMAHRHRLGMEPTSEAWEILLRCERITKTIGCAVSEHWARRIERYGG